MAIDKMQAESRKDRIANLFKSHDNVAAYDNTEKKLFSEMLFLSTDDTDIIAMIKNYDEYNFHSPLNQALFRNFRDIVSKQSINFDFKKLDASLELDDHEYVAEDYEAAGGFKLIKSLLKSGQDRGGVTATVDDIPELLNTIHKFSNNRMLLDKAIDFIDDIDLDKVKGEDELETKFAEVSKFFYDLKNTAEDNTLPIKQIIGEWENILYGNRDEDGVTIGLKTGFENFDKLSGGLRGGQMVVVGARPATGKTAFTLTLADSIMHNPENFKDGKKPNVLMFSLEMGRFELTERLLALKTGLPVNKIRQGGMGDYDWGEVGTANNDMKKHGHLYIDDTPGMNINEISKRVAKVDEETGGLDVIIVDYLQLIETDNGQRNVGVGEISRELKKLAKLYDTTVISLVQLNRDVESRSDKRPMMSDIRESGAIEQDADMIMMLWLNDFYEDDDDDDFEVEQSPESMIFVSFVKNRAGANGDIRYLFHKDVMTFVELGEEFENDDMIADGNTNKASGILFNDADENSDAISGSLDAIFG